MPGPRIPTVGGDLNVWGTVITEYLQAALAEYNIMLDPYGAVADHTTDNSTAIQNAINDAEASGKGMVVIPDVMEAGKSVTGIASTDLFTCTSHGYGVGDEVRFSGLTGGTGITAGQHYYVIASGLTASEFRVSNVPGGSTINFTTDLTAGTVKRRGAFSCGGLELKDNVALVGGGVLKQRSASTYLLSVNSGSQGTADPNDNKKNIALVGITLLGTTLVDGFLQGNHLLNVNACSRLMVWNVKFIASRSDGIYFGSSNQGATERHNVNCKVLYCTFDGVNKDNRNCISIIDGDDILIQGCTFKNWARTDMPGGIDIEPNNNSFARMRDIRVLDNHFDNIGGNVGNIVFDCVQTQAALTTKTERIIFSGNTIKNTTNSGAGIFIRHHQTPTSTTIRNDITIEGNKVDMTSAAVTSSPLYLEGIRGLLASGNTWSNCGGGIAVGWAYKCMDIDLEEETYFKLGTTGGTVIDIYSVDGLRIHRPTYDTIGGGGSGRLTSFGYNSGVPSVSANVELIGARVLGTGHTTVSSKHASHTLSQDTNLFDNDNNVAGLVPNPLHWNALHPSVASAATITIPQHAKSVLITGTTSITSIAASWPGRRIVLVFAGVVTLTNGSNLRIGTNFTSSADDAIALVCDGTNWYRIAAGAVN